MKYKLVISLEIILIALLILGYFAIEARKDVFSKDCRISYNTNLTEFNMFPCPCHQEQEDKQNMPRNPLDLDLSGLRAINSSG